MKQTIGIIGGGNMGSAIIAGIRRNYNVSVCEADKIRAQNLKNKYRIRAIEIHFLIKKCNVIVLAVKPQDFDSILNQIQPVITPKHIVISIAAGITTAYIEKRLGKVRVIRTMPNLPAQIKEGITAIAKGKFAKSTDVHVAETILSGIGKTVVMNEKWIDAVTAVSGSGPAYVFYFVECFLKAAENLGFDKRTARQLVETTLRGSVDLLLGQNEAASVLRERVTSKGGTTQAALEVFQNKKIEDIFIEALQAAQKRAKELSK